jgi:cyclophilin family peptidyl-prolyl cis-trans isomerase
MLNFECPSCKTKCETSNEYAGMQMPCPKCGKILTAPAAIAAGEPKLPPSRSQQAAGADRSASPAPAQGGGNMLLYGIIGIVVVVGIIVVGALLNSSNGPSGDNPVVVMETSMGSIKIELFQDKAPVTVANFLKYVDDKHYDGTIFHRVIADFMIQGGGFLPGQKEKGSKYARIRNEAGNGLKNERGTIAMARTNEPDSATDQFFINVKDNPNLDRNAKSAGYAVFGRVIGGMDVVDAIRNVKTIPDGGENAVPVTDVIIRSVRREQSETPAKK